MSGQLQDSSLVDHADLSLERIVFFSDAVMAIAITLLVIDLKLPESTGDAHLGEQLAELTPRIVSFVISFAVVGVYWSAHHRYFREIKRYDGSLIALNLVFLLFIALMPFAAHVLGEYGNEALGIAIYGVAVAGTGLSLGAIWWYASVRHRLVESTLDSRFIRNRRWAGLVVPLIFLASVPVAWLNPIVSQALWIVAAIVSRLLERRPKTVRATAL
jgi:uncharacterized membrane protein